MAWIIPSMVNASTGNGPADIAAQRARGEAARYDSQADAVRYMADARTAEANVMADARRYEADQERITAVNQSNNQLSAERMQNSTMRYGIMTNSRDFQFQILAWLTAQLEGIDTKAQIAMKDAEVRITQIGSDERIERDKVKLDARELEIREAELNQSRQSQNNVSLGSFRV